MPTKILVTGGAGYVGSHCARLLHMEGFEVVTVDSLSQGHREAVTGRLVVADLRDRETMHELLAEGFDAVLHFAARMSVPESVEDPIGYYDVNVGGTAILLGAMQAAGCRHLVFSSTCAVYGEPSEVPIHEDETFGPIPPYGDTKAAVERMVDAARAQGVLQATSLRYFNAAGAAADGALGEAHHPESHLIPIALRAAQTGRQMTVFGTDHPTRDGTCVRDYVHVEDLATAHLLALRRLLEGHPGSAYNLGTGEGASVRELLDTIEEVTGHKIHRIHGPRRAGDPPTLVSDTRRSASELGWKPRHDLRAILSHAWAWAQAPRFGPDA